MARHSAPTVGFTLIEALVVMGIIAVVAAMVVPAFSSLQARHHLSTCATNLKTIGQALLMYRADYMGFPPDASEWWVEPDPPQEGLHGLGLAQLYYAYWAYEQAGPLEYELPPGDYLRDVSVLKCPRAPRDTPDFSAWPYLGGYNVYDWNYRRDRSAVWPQQGLRHLKQPFPPDNTVVTWCPMHRSNPPSDETSLGDIHGNDYDLVLWADGSVSRMPSRYDQYKAEQPP